MLLLQYPPLLNYENEKEWKEVEVVHSTLLYGGEMQLSNKQMFIQFTWIFKEVDVELEWIRGKERRSQGNAVLIKMMNWSVLIRTGAWRAENY